MRKTLCKMCLLVLLVVAWSSVGVFAANAVSLEFGFSGNLEGFSGSKVEPLALITDVYNDNFIKVVRKAGNSYSALQINNQHPNWTNDWSSWDEIEFAIYFDEDVYLRLRENTKAVTVRIQANARYEVLIEKSSLTPGWNQFNIPLAQIVSGDVSALADMGEAVLMIIVDSDPSDTEDSFEFHVKRIRLVPAADSAASATPIPEAPKISSAEITQLIADLKEMNFATSTNASNRLVEIGEPAVPFLVPALRIEKDSINRTKAQNVLYRIGTEQAIKALLVSLEDPDLLVQESLNKLIIRLYEEGNDNLISLLGDCLVAQNRDIRIASYRILLNLGLNPSQLAHIYLDLLLEQQDEAARLFALQGLRKARVDAGAVINQLLGALGDENSLEIKLSLLLTVALTDTVESKAIYPSLVNMLLDNDETLRLEAIWLLHNAGFSGEDLVGIATESWHDLIESQKAERIKILGLMAYTQKEAAFALMDLLRDESQSATTRKAVYDIFHSMLPQMEYDLDRGLVAVLVPEGVFVSWRLLGIEDFYTQFNLYRDGAKVNPEPLTQGTNYLDPLGDLDSTYTVRKLVEGVEQEDSPAAIVWEDQYLSIPLKQVEGDEDWEYRVTYASVGDLDGDGQYEIVVRREPILHESKYVVGDKYIVFDAYKLDGTFLWRINMGPNINEINSLHFLVYDLDGDGKAEMILRTSDGTVDGQGNVIGKKDVDYRPRTPNYIIDPERTEYMTVFDGTTGKMIANAPDIPMDAPSKWGDSRGHRASSRRMAVAYFDGVNPSLITSRGAYELIEILAYDLVDGNLITRWHFSSADWPGFSQQGNHSLSVADVHGNGKDVITYGAMAVNYDGTGLYTTEIGHGDALHVGKFLLDRPGLQAFDVAEFAPCSEGIHVRDARTGEILWSAASGYDIRSALTADVDPNYPGNEFWVANGNLYTAHGDIISKSTPSLKFATWWDGDLLREVMSNHVSSVYKWDYETNTNRILFNPSGVANQLAALQADILGDWREELIWPNASHTALRLYTTVDLTEHRIYTLMHDRMYRVAVAWQNVGYNHPPHPSFYIGSDMEIFDFNWGLVYDLLEEYQYSF